MSQYWINFKYQVVVKYRTWIVNCNFVLDNKKTSCASGWAGIQYRTQQCCCAIQNFRERLGSAPYHHSYKWFQEKRTNLVFIRSLLSILLNISCSLSFSDIAASRALSSSSPIRFSSYLKETCICIVFLNANRND